MRLLANVTFRYMCSHLGAAGCNLSASSTSWGLSVSLTVTARSSRYRAIRISHSHPNWTGSGTDKLWVSSLLLKQRDHGGDYSVWTWSVLQMTDSELIGLRIKLFQKLMGDKTISNDSNIWNYKYLPNKSRNKQNKLFQHAVFFKSQHIFVHKLGLINESSRDIHISQCQFFSEFIIISWRTWLCRLKELLKGS